MRRILKTGHLWNFSIVVNLIATFICTRRFKSYKLDAASQDKNFLLLSLGCKTRRNCVNHLRSQEYLAIQIFWTGKKLLSICQIHSHLYIQHSVRCRNQLYWRQSRNSCLAERILIMVLKRKRMSVRHQLRWCRKKLVIYWINLKRRVILLVETWFNLRTMNFWWKQSQINMIQILKDRPNSKINNRHSCKAYFQLRCR